MNESSIFALFERDPAEYQVGDLDKIIATLREKRANFDLSGSSAKLEKDPKKAKAKSEMAQLSLGLDLDL